MDCVEDTCHAKCTGYDIEKCFDSDDEPIYAVFYECDDGHHFVAEYERKCKSVGVESIAT